MQCDLSKEEKEKISIFLSNLTFLSLAEKKIVEANASDFEALSALSLGDISNLVKRKFSARVKYEKTENVLFVERAVKIISSLGISILKNDDLLFPALLREIPDAPFLLYCRGDISCLRQKSVSLVGTREITPEGRTAARKFAHEAAVAGYSVISGLAYGVDAEAHNGATDAFYDALEISEQASLSVGKTCAVLPGGIDEIVPSGNKRLAQKIVQSGGLLISECPPAVPVEKWRFVSRNRIIAALSPATIVVEAPPASGALITAEMAVGYGRELFFMRAAFSENAQKMAERRLATLAKRQPPKKHIALASSFVEDGAQIIEDFSAFTEKMHCGF